MGGFKFEHINVKMKKNGNGEINMTSYKKAEGDDHQLDQPDNTSETEESCKDYHRGTWSRKTDFLLSIIGYSVGVSNIWRFPYLCIRNGGGAFLIPFFFFLFFCGIPLFFLELCLGQFSGVSSLFVWKLCPLFNGLGYLMVIVSYLMSWYYIMVIVWVLYYLVNSFYNPLPWSVCTNDWNTENCIEDIVLKASNTIKNSTISNSSMYSYSSNFTLDGNSTIALNGSLFTYTTMNKTIEEKLTTAAKEFWQLQVLQISTGLEDVGGIRWHLVVALLIAWILVFICLMKGVKTVGKVVYVTAVLPYFLLTTFLIKGLTLPGALTGIKYYLTPDWSRLLEFQVWLEAGIQVFYSLGPAWGGLITMSSYNKFHNNCFRDAIIGSLADGLTSFYGGFVIFAVLGFMSEEANLPIEDVATSGPGLALVAYPAAITKLPFPQIWAVLFFLMLLTLGIDSQFGTFETVSSGLTDAFPKQLGNKKVLVTAVLSLILFILGLPFTTNGGMYLFQLVDWYAASLCVLLTSFLECVIVGWIYGADRFSKDIELMIGRPPPLLIRICWCVLTPVVMLVSFCVTVAQYQPPSYEGYTYPGFARVIGLLLSVIPIIPLPVLMVIQILKQEGSLLKRVLKLLRPAPDWGPHIYKFKKDYEVLSRQRNIRFVDYVRINLIGSTKK